MAAMDLTEDNVRKHLAEIRDLRAMLVRHEHCLKLTSKIDGNIQWNACPECMAPDPHHGPDCEWKALLRPR